ncbi:MAG: SHOCT domain-containing protein [Patescibacteria group bacterium]|nr:SHOCT domain-containing protein [Patescibacteria group bacterium]
MMGYFWPNHMGWGFGSFGFLGLIGVIFNILFWVLIVLLIVSLFKHLSGSKEAEKESDSSLKILKERYARGEINKEEFDQKKKDLLP